MHNCTLLHKDIFGQEQSGRGGFELGDSWNEWGTLLERRQMVTSFFCCEQEEETR